LIENSIGHQQKMGESVYFLKLCNTTEKLRAANVDKIVSEKVSGVSLEREKLDDLLNMLVKGDTLVVARMDRLGRNTKQLLELVEHLEEKGVFLNILDLGIDTSKLAGKFILDSSFCEETKL
ncbi:recombinase family protein, partial [Enterococcus faecalis]|uniref:recombinase family protein n=1 Tax=Enterococcus faecalis TaxID=1351 RepID=UPI00313C8657